MKNAYLLAVLSALLLTAACEKPENGETVVDQETPSIEVGLEDALTVPSEKGEASIPYEIVNPVEGGIIYAVSSEDWAGEFVYDTPGTLVFTVSENEHSEERSTVITLTYTYGDDETVTAEVEVIQQPFVATYDYEFEMTYFRGTYYGDKYGNEGEHSYYMQISDIGFRGNGIALPEGAYYVFDIFAPAPADLGCPSLPAGTYTLGEEGTTLEMTFTPENSSAVQYTESGYETVFNVTFVEGTLDVSYDGEVMNMEACLTDNEARRHHVVFIGTAVFDNQSGQLAEINKDVEFEPDMAYAFYVSHDEVMQVGVQLTDMEVDNEGFMIAPGTYLYVDAYMPVDDSGNFPTGTYTMSESKDIMTIYPTVVMENNGTSSCSGTYAQHCPDEYTLRYGIFVDGKMEVSGEPGNYTVELSMKTVAGYTVTAIYNGPMEINGLPIMSDVEVDLEGVSVGAYYYGDMYGTGAGNWMLEFYPPDYVGDGMCFELATEEIDFAAGISTAVYKPAADVRAPKAGEYIPGYFDGQYSVGSCYIDYINSSQGEYMYIDDGDLNITNNGDGTYDVSFNLVGDNGKKITGQWSGTIEALDLSMYLSPQFPEKVKAVGNNGKLKLQR